jgi:siroheme synthase-like protein
MNHKTYYPVYFDLAGLPCLVVGGGPVAERKVKTLREAGAAVTVVSPEITSAIRGLHKAGAITYIAARYRTSHLAGARLVFGATNNEAVNRKIFADCELRRIPVNIVDVPDLCRFIVPSILQEGDIQVAVSTGGAAPMVARIIRQELAQAVPKYRFLVAELKKRRMRIKALPGPQKEKFWEQVGNIPARRLKDHKYLVKQLDRWME